MKHLKTLVPLICVLMLFGCNPYRKITYTKTDFYKKKRIVENVDRYDVYVVKGDKQYKFQVKEIDGTKVKGSITPIPASSLPQLDSLEDVPKEIRDDMIIHLNDSEDTQPSSEEEIIISSENLSEVEMIGKSDNGALGVIWTTLLIVLGIFVGLILILVLAIVSAGAGSDSGGSDSGGSDSGGSDSGGSDSGGSDSSGGCFVATMAYGSYDSDEVLILRAFRDKFLQKFGAGRWFIQWYYANSPAFVAQHHHRNWLKKSLRAMLNLIVGFLRPICSK